MVSRDNLDSTVDVVIIGAGPAGFMAAAWMAHLGISARIVDKRSDKVQRGQADGIHARTMEIFDSFGFADRVLKESNPLVETYFWVPDGNGGIKRQGGGPFVVPGISRFGTQSLPQSRIESFFLDNLRKHSAIKVERGVIPESLEIDEAKVEDTDAYPITIKLRHLTETTSRPSQPKGTTIQNGFWQSNLIEDDTEKILQKSQERSDTTETVRAKYVIGCDGAHSWTRKQIGCRLEGDSTDFVFGVVDIIPITDFPDIRQMTSIHSAEHGLLYVVPRENKLVRFYVQLDEVKPDQRSGRVDPSSITPKLIVEAARKIMTPYKLSYKYCEWFTAYQVGRRMGNAYHKFNRVFLAGDAVHTHSPRGGQGMNLGMHDTYNLGWKIGLCVKNMSPRTILSTYQSERRQIAQDLIDFDSLTGDPVSGKGRLTDDKSISQIEPYRLGLLSANFYGGFTVHYDKSVLVVKEKKGRKGVAWTEDVTNKIEVGMRVPNLQILRQGDASVWTFLQWLKSDGRFRILLFAGDIKYPAQKARVQSFCDSLEGENSLLKRVTPAKARIDSVIEILTLHSSPRAETSIFDFPALLHPFDEEKGWDYNKIFVDDWSYHQGHGEAYKNAGVDPKRGAVVVVRPDQYVAYTGEMEDIADIERYFENMLLNGSQHLPTRS